MSIVKTVLGMLLSIMLISANADENKEQSHIPGNNNAIVIHGYTLPPAPDPAINNATLLGIDSNNNGVRDDVEIWILKKYKDKHPIYTEIAMQDARNIKKVFEDPNNAVEDFSAILSAGHCASYYRVCSENNSSIHIKSDLVGRSYEKIVFNTEARKEAYAQFSSHLSGGTYTMPWCSELKEFCDFNTTKFEQLP